MDVLSALGREPAMYIGGSWVTASETRPVINQVGTLTSYTQQVVTGAFLIVVVAAQTYLTRKRTY